MSEKAKQLSWVVVIIIFLLVSFVGMYLVFENTIQNKDRVVKELPVRYTAQHGNSAISTDDGEDSN